MTLGEIIVVEAEAVALCLEAHALVQEHCRVVNGHMIRWYNMILPIDLLWKYGCTTRNEMSSGVMKAQPISRLQL